MNFIIYDATGVILRTGSCPSDMAAMQAQEGEYVMEGEANPDVHFVVNSEVFSYTSDELTTKNNLPLGFVWQMPERIAVDMRPIEDVQAQTWNRIKSQREAIDSSPFMYDGMSFDSDKIQLPAAVQMALIAKDAGQPFSIDWTLADNTVVTLTGEQVVAAALALGDRTQRLHDASRALRVYIQTCEDREELDSLNLIFE